ncbi:hypothetical protein [Lacinutrix chionoecetis]
MAPIKFEDDMKERLEKRTIEPSAKSWDTLAQRLNNEANKSNKKGYWWLGIAASIVGVILISNMFFKQNTTIKSEIIIVDETIEKDTINTNIKEETIIVPQQKVIVTAKEKQTTIKKKVLVNKPNKTQQHLASHTEKEYKQNKTLVTENSVTDLVKQNKKHEVVIETYVQNNSEKTENTTIADNEIDILLNQAMRDIAMQKEQKTNIPIDYNGLLIDVEDELAETFRDKLVKMARKGYESFKESVAERND